MSPKRIHILMYASLVIAFLLFLTTAYEINGLLQSQASNLISLKAKTTALSQEQTSLSQDKSDITKYSALYSIAQSIVPENKDQAQTVRQIVNLASLNNVNLTSISFPSSSLGSSVPIAPGAGAAPLPRVSAGSGNPNLSQLTAIPNIPGVYELPITIQSSTQSGKETTYPELIGFLSALENNRLTALVSSITITPDHSNNSLFSFIIHLNIYIKPVK